jgi:hypothetical protein
VFQLLPVLHHSRSQPNVLQLLPVTIFPNKKTQGLLPGQCVSGIDTLHFHQSRKIRVYTTNRCNTIHQIYFQAARTLRGNIFPH